MLSWLLGIPLETGSVNSAPHAALLVQSSILAGTLSRRTKDSQRTGEQHCREDRPALTRRYQHDMVFPCTPVQQELLQ